MANSAHDDIALTIDHSEVSRYAEILSTSKFGDPGDAFALLNLIRQIEESKDDDASIKVIELILENSDRPVNAKFSIEVLNNPGWLKHFPELIRAYTNEIEAAQIVEKIAEQNFDISFHDVSAEYPNFTLEELLEMMDLFSVGRPSTIAKTLSIMAEHDLIKLNDDFIYPTEQGVKALLATQYHFPGLANRTFSARLSTLQREIETGNKSIAEALHELLPDTIKGANVQALAECAWTEIDEIYESTQHPEMNQGLIKGRW